MCRCSQFTHIIRVIQLTFASMSAWGNGLVSKYHYVEYFQQE